MKVRGQQSLLFNNIHWRLFPLGEQTLLLQGPSDIPIEQIHDSTTFIQEVLKNELTDIVPSYDSIALFHRGDAEELFTGLSKHRSHRSTQKRTQERIEIPICYELGLDLDEVANHVKLEVEQLIELHLSGEYRSILIGFTPGFIYMDGLDPTLECPRKANPRKYLEPGSVGIGGTQTGIYSLASPGGWNIIGRTPMKIFDMEHQPPMQISVGSNIVYRRITLDQFESWES